ncbi:MAG: mechanosensitive ion channel family protein [Acetobacteraceae bacterium]|nr:mechanosensitive ion channel family protein [Acetobacteraceae bacterium]
MRRTRLWLTMLILPLLALRAEAAGLQPDLDTSSPRATYASFFDGLRRVEALYANYRADKSESAQLALFRALQRLGSRMFDLSEVPPATRLKHGSIAVGYMADILMRLPPLPPDRIPGTPPTAAADLPATWTIPDTEIRLRRLTDGPWAGHYVFSADTVERLPEFHAAIIGQPVLRTDLAALSHWREAQLHFTGPLLSALPLAALPPPFQAVILGAPVWKIMLSALAVALAALAVARIARRVRQRASRATGWHRPALLMLAPLTMALVSAATVLLTGWEIGLAGPLFDATLVLVTVALYAAAAWAAWLLCDLVVAIIIALPSIPDESYDAHLLRLLARVASVAAVVGIALHGAASIGVPALSLLAGVSVGGIALALAAQSTVENLFGGISIFADRPFRVGDSIQGGNVTGTVESVGPRSSRIRGADGTLTTVPNSDLAKMHITNVTARTGYLFRHTLRLGGETPRAAVEALLETLRARLQAEPRVAQEATTPRVRLVGFGEASLDIEVFAKAPAASQADFLEVQEALILMILRAVEEGGMRLAVAPVPAEPAAAGGGASVQAHA